MLILTSFFTLDLVIFYIIFQSAKKKQTKTKLAMLIGCLNMSYELMSLFKKTLFLLLSLMLLKMDFFTPYAS